MKEEKIIENLKSKFDKEYQEAVNIILNNDEFKKRLTFHHHENRSVYTHSLFVSFYSYKIAKIMHLDCRKTAIGGLLHDFYCDDWQTNPKKGIKNLHGFIHAKEAYKNTEINFPEFSDEKIKDIIEKHMFPLTIKPPIYLESWIVSLVDKAVSLEVLLYPKQWYKYIGLALIFKGRIK